MQTNVSYSYPTNPIFTDIVPYMPLEVVRDRKLLAVMFTPLSNRLSKLGQVQDKKTCQKMLIFSHPNRSDEDSMDFFMLVCNLGCI